MSTVISKVMGTHCYTQEVLLCRWHQTFSTEVLSYYFMCIYLVFLDCEFLKIRDLGFYIIELPIKSSIELGQEDELTKNT